MQTRLKFCNKASFFILLLSFLFLSCSRVPHENWPNDEKVIIIVMDGARYSETFGDTSKKNIPMLAQMAHEGVVYSNFYNNGPTYTTAGHTAITTGIYQEINNAGNESPLLPSIFHYLNFKFHPKLSETWIICSKDKLAVLGTCQHPTWMKAYGPSVNCGINGLGSGYRADSSTCSIVLNVLAGFHPKLILVNFMEPDYSGHSGKWDAYVKGISSTDSLIYQIWQFIQKDTCYKNKTTLIVTNDHGRHLDGVGGGFASHGDTCAGCRHIMLFASGPDIKKGAVIDTAHGLIDIPVTAAKILGFSFHNGPGKLMNEMFICN